MSMRSDEMYSVFLFLNFLERQKKRFTDEDIPKIAQYIITLMNVNQGLCEFHSSRSFTDFKKEMITLMNKFPEIVMVGNLISKCSEQTKKMHACKDRLRYYVYNCIFKALYSEEITQQNVYRFFEDNKVTSRKKLNDLFTGKGKSSKPKGGSTHGSENSKPKELTHGSENSKPKRLKHGSEGKSTRRERAPSMASSNKESTSMKSPKKTKTG